MLAQEPSVAKFVVPFEQLNPVTFGQAQFVRAPRSKIICFEKDRRQVSLWNVNLKMGVAVARVAPTLAAAPGVSTLARRDASRSLVEAANSRLALGSPGEETHSSSRESGIVYQGRYWGGGGYHLRMTSRMSPTSGLDDAAAILPRFCFPLRALQSCPRIRVSRRLVMVNVEGPGPIGARRRGRGRIGASVAARH